MDKVNALYTLEGALNFYFRKPMQYTLISDVESTVLNLDIIDGVVSGSSLESEFIRIQEYAQEGLEEGQVIDLIDISTAVDSNGVEQPRAVVVTSTASISQSYYQDLGDWKAGALGGECVNGTYGSTDASLKIGQLYNYHYANNFLMSTVDHTQEVYYTNIEVAGTGGGGSFYGYPSLVPDRYIPRQARDPWNDPTLLGDFELPGSPIDNMHPSPGIDDCIYESEINTYASRLEQKIYTVSPSTGLGQEPYKVLMSTDWLMVQGGNPPAHHQIFAAFFGKPHLK